MSAINTRRHKARKNVRKTSPRVRIKQALGVVLSVFRVVLIVAAVVGMSVIFIFGHDLITQCDYLRAEKVLVEGQRLLEADQIKKQAGIREGLNLLAVNLPLSRKRLLNHPWIKDAQIRREFPSTLHIRVMEQKPLAVLDLGQRFVMNSEGEIFKKYNLSDPKNLPMVTGLKYYDLKAGDDPGSSRFAAVMQVLDLQSRPELAVLNGFIQKIEVDPNMGLTLLAFEDKKVIKLGFENYSQKLDGLKMIMTHPRLRDTHESYTKIDLMNPNRIVVYPAQTPLSEDGKKETGI